MRPKEERTQEKDVWILLFLQGTESLGDWFDIICIEVGDGSIFVFLFLWNKNDNDNIYL